VLDPEVHDVLSYSAVVMFADGNSS